MPMTARCGAAALCRGAATVRVAAHETSGGKLLVVWIAQSACRCSCSCMRNSWQSRPRHAQQCVPHNQPTPCGRCSVRSTQSAAFIVLRWKRMCNCLDCHEFSSTPLRFRPNPRKLMQLSFRPHPRMQLQLHALCALPTTRLVCGNCLTVAAPRHSAAAPHRAVMGIKRRPVKRPVEHACVEAPRAPRN
jgi:hypothetical protein